MASGVSFSLNTGRPLPPITKAGADDGSKSHSNGTKRSHAFLGDESDDDGTPSKQMVTHFDAKGAYNSAKPVKEKAPLIINPQANRDWREASKDARAFKRGQSGAHTQHADSMAKSREEELKRIEDARKPIYGLNLKAQGSSDDAQKNDPHDAGDNRDAGNTKETDGSVVPSKPQTDDERAIESLLGIKAQSDLTIPNMTEDEAFQRDFSEAPPMATLEQYAATPVEEFGAALLRGMGWKDGQGIGNQSGQKVKKAQVPERRPALLGIGAKQEAAVQEELGSWGRGAKKGKPDRVYNPVVMRNKITGEEVTEEELQAKLERQNAPDDGSVIESQRDERRSRRNEYSSDEDDRRRRERRRDRDREDERDRKRDKDSGRDRYRDRERQRSDYDSDRKSKGSRDEPDSKDRDYYRENRDSDKDRDRYKERRRDHRGDDRRRSHREGRHERDRDYDGRRRR